MNAVRMDVKANDPVNAADFSTTSKDGGGGGSMMNDVDACAEMAGATSNKQCNEASVIDISDNNLKGMNIYVVGLIFVLVVWSTAVADHVCFVMYLF